MQEDRIKTKNELHEAIQGALRQADTYDREVYEGMGVKTLWTRTSRTCRACWTPSGSLRRD